MSNQASSVLLGLAWLISVKSPSESFLSHLDSLRDSKTSLAPSTQSLMLERSFGSQTTLNGTEEALALSNMATSKHGKRLHNPVVRILDAQVTLPIGHTVISPWKYG